MNFKHSESVKSILPALIKVQSEMPQLSKDANNPHAKSKYVTLDNILGKLNPLLNKNGIFLTQIPVEESTESSQRIGVETVFWHKDGEYISYPAVLYEFEKGGRMNLTQSVGSIITYARRYALTSILGLSTNEDDDGVQPTNNQNYNNQSYNNQYKNNQQNTPQNKQKRPPQDDFTSKVNNITDRIEKLSEASGQDKKEIRQVMLQRTNAETGNKDKKITKDNVIEYNKQLRLAEANFKKQQTEQSKQTDQTSLMEGNATTSKVAWGQ